LLQHLEHDQFNAAGSLVLTDQAVNRSTAA
jgi:hypothetical protein